MRKILYLHGLESPQGGEKIDFLASKNFVCAPSIDYSRPDLESYLLGITERIKPDLIIGSSMGGHVGLMLANYYSIDCIVFNPAIHSRPIEPELPRLEAKNPNFNFMPVIVLGSKDDVIDHEKTLDILEQCEFYSDIEEVEGLGHRIPNDVFIDIYNKYVK